MKKHHKKQQKRGIEKKQEPNFRERSLQWWATKNPVLKFALGFAVLMGIFYAMWVTNFFTDNILKPAVQANAWIASKILLLIGYDPTVVDSTLTSPGISIEVGRGCDAFEPIAIFLSAVLLFPASFRSKFIGVSTGVPILLVLNQFRIITMYIAGAHSITLFGKDHEWYFNLIHLQIWPVIFIVATLVLLAYWILFSLRQEKSQQEPAT